jgi:hypothetical protein
MRGSFVFIVLLNYTGDCSAPLRVCFATVLSVSRGYHRVAHEILDEAVLDV